MYSSAKPLVHAIAVRHVRCHSIACLALLVWHRCLTFDEDIHYIWTMRNKNPLKWVYFFLRYVVLLASVIHNLLIEPLANGSNPPVFCALWHAYIMAFTQILGTMLEFILAFRVFALYSRSRRIAFLLSILMLAEVAGTVRMLWLPKGTDFYETCLLLRMDENARCQGILGFMVHCVIIGLTFAKYFRAFHAGWSRNPLISLVVRDGSITYGTVIFVFLAVLFVFGLKNERGVAVFYWVTLLYSISGCRMILSMERMARREISIELPPPIFTSYFSIESN